MGKDIGRVYKNSRSQLSIPSIKEPVISYLDSQTSSSTALTITSVYSVIYKEQTDFVLCSQNTIQKYLNITNSHDIQYFETPIT